MKCLSLLLLPLLILAPAAAGQSVADIPATRDNTLYQDPDGNLSNGAGQYLFAGMTARSEVRRGLVKFDLSSAFTGGIVVDSVQVQLHMNKSLGGNHDVSLHRVGKDWGEGSSNPTGEEGGGTTPVAGDATWLHTFTPTTRWTAAGGDFTSTASATQSIQATGTVIWYSTQALINDVQHWLDTPAENFGWLLKGNESVNSSAMRFSSRENPTQAQRPVLRVYYRSVSTHTESNETPATFTLSEAWPNPFSSATRLSVNAERSEDVRLEVIDVQGRTVLETVQRLQPGENALQLDGTSWAPGVYWVRVQGASFSMTRSLIRLR